MGFGWFGDSESVGQRTQRMRGENAERQHQNARIRDDINYRRAQEAEYEKKNWEHKTLAFQAEQRSAASAGRLPMFMSPAMVQDMPRPYQPPKPVAPQPEPAQHTPLNPLLVIALVAGFVIFVIIPTIFAMLGPIIQIAFQIIGSVLLIGAAGLTVTWLILHFTAKDDPAKIHRAKLFDPIRVV
ncbi:hypothetical protein GCM10009712_20320 [Pseudarthrobacter sulfonivorans]|uniref:hypothetical protein n=1 Tax=Pseudarthrobacter sulfonivorans TaxID=121292 RepID=UPI00168A7C50|nr:hypothetical protein [Pseudarthrobacter sulfonivorans]